MAMVLRSHLTGSCVHAIADAPQAAPATQAGHTVHQLDESAPETGVHVAVDDRIVAAVRHGQPVKREPHIRQRIPVGELLVVQ